MVEVQSEMRHDQHVIENDSQVNPDTSSTFLSEELSTINTQLLNHGWAKKPLNLTSLSEKNYNEVVSVLYDLLGSSVTNINTLDSMATRHRTLQYEYERLSKTNSSFKNTNIKLQQETNAWKVRCLEIEKRLNNEEIKTKELREEIGRGRKAIESVRVAATHETKKIQMKLDKALLQLSKQSESQNQKTSSSSSGLILLNPIPAGRIQPIASTASPLLEQTLRDLTDMRESLQEETEAFRHVVVSTGNALREAIAASQGKDAPARLMQSQFFTLNNNSLKQSHQSQTYTFQSSSSTSHPSIAQTRLQSLIFEIREKLMENAPPPVPSNGIYGPTPEEIEDNKRIEREQEKMKRDLEDRVKDLEVELICLRKKEDEASRVLQEMARKELEAATAKGDMEGVLAKQLEIMEIERKAVVDNRERLDKERRQLEIEKQTFLEEKRQSELDAVLALLPTTPLDDPQSDQVEIHQDIRDLIPSSPGPSTWHPHLPHSPSPLSPMPHHNVKPRTPKNHSHTHTANRRKSMKTPLSRLVLEKAVRQKSKETISEREREKGQLKASLNSSVLGPDRGRKTNLVSSSSSIGRVMSPSRKDKERSIGLGSFPKSTDQGRQSSTSSSKARSSSGSSTSTSIANPSKGPTPRLPSTLKPSNGVAGLRTSTSGTTMGSTSRKMDLNQAGGIGPMAARKSKGAWR
ncbi:uncharacterized protein IL334_004327 [Kwoniella shivajii]|uniref:Afadin and alpha-actinin-binding-domain-containing protein n=1 Tax=Kwoniella shivajii TaxID=564305 RepID=A0ABZ1D308_9TREE|nr:hypothetical protein IL334_004327 [Kwoniella shivajii]